jgi:hypothetical protein
MCTSVRAVKIDQPWWCMVSRASNVKSVIIDYDYGSNVTTYIFEYGVPSEIISFDSLFFY